MTAFDYAVIVVVVLSVALGWWRGLVYEAVALLSWCAAYMVARQFADAVVLYLPAGLGTEVMRMAVAFSLLFIVTLVVGGILAWAMHRVVKAAELEKLDSSFGALFGFVRGLVLVLVLVLVAGMTALPQTEAWHGAVMSGALEEIALQVRTLLPDGLAQKIRYRD